MDNALQQARNLFSRISGGVGQAANAYAKGPPYIPFAPQLPQMPPPAQQIHSPIPQAPPMQAPAAASLPQSIGNFANKQIIQPAMSAGSNLWQGINAPPSSPLPMNGNPYYAAGRSIGGGALAPLTSAIQGAGKLPGLINQGVNLARDIGPI